MYSVMLHLLYRMMLEKYWQEQEATTSTFTVDICIMVAV